MNKTLFRFNKWFKGNLHSHSTISDGTYSPEELKEVYKKNGYSFFAYSDHNVFRDLRHLNDEDFITYFSSEIKSYSEETSTGCGDYRTYHMNCLQNKKNNSYVEFEMLPMHNENSDHLRNTQHLIDAMNQKGFLVTINHPIWSRMLPEDLLNLDGYFAIEIYNSQCAIDGDDDGKGTLYWDLLLRNGKKVYGIAADDNHNKYDVMVGTSEKIGFDHKRSPSMKGWVMVNAEKLDDKCIAEALENGEFYSSTGPSIYKYQIIDDILEFACSDCKQITVVSYDARGFSYFDTNEIKHKLSGNEKYIRVECTDKNGNKAWTNPIFLK